MNRTRMLGADGYATRPIASDKLDKPMNVKQHRPQKGKSKMPKAKPRSKKSNRPSAAQVIFLVLTVVIILSFVLSLVKI